MTPTESHGHERLAKIRRYRRLGVASLLAGIAGLVLASNAGYTLLGVAVYWAGALGMVALWKGTSLELYDEREQEIEKRASAATLAVFALVLIVGAPGLVALEEAGVYDAPPAVSGAIWGYVALYVVFGAIYTVYRYRS